MKNAAINEILTEKGFLLADGATGTNLLIRGLETVYPPELWSVERPDDIQGLYASFFDAGSDFNVDQFFWRQCLAVKAA